MQPVLSCCCTSFHLIADVENGSGCKATKVVTTDHVLAKQLQ